MNPMTMVLPLSSGGIVAAGLEEGGLFYSMTAANASHLALRTVHRELSSAPPQVTSFYSTGDQSPYIRLISGGHSASRLSRFM